MLALVVALAPLRAGAGTVGTGLARVTAQAEPCVWGSTAVDMAPWELYLWAVVGNYAAQHPGAEVGIRPDAALAAAGPAPAANGAESGAASGQPAESAPRARTLVIEAAVTEPVAGQSVVRVQGDGQTWSLQLEAAAPAAPPAIASEGAFWVRVGPGVWPLGSPAGASDTQSGIDEGPTWVRLAPDAWALRPVAPAAGDGAAPGLAMDSLQLGDAVWMVWPVTRLDPAPIPVLFVYRVCGEEAAAAVSQSAAPAPTPAPSSAPTEANCEWGSSVVSMSPIELFYWAVALNYIGQHPGAEATSLVGTPLAQDTYNIGASGEGVLGESSQWIQTRPGVHTLVPQAPPPMTEAVDGEGLVWVRGGGNTWSLQIDRRPPPMTPDAAGENLVWVRVGPGVWTLKPTTGAPIGQAETGEQLVWVRIAPDKWTLRPKSPAAPYDVTPTFYVDWLKVDENAWMVWAVTQPMPIPISVLFVYRLCDQ